MLLRQTSTDSRWRRLLAPVLLIVLPFVYFYPAVIGDLTLAPGDGWTANLGLKWLVGRMIADGHLPLWNPYIFAGMPLLATVYPGALYPPNWLFALPDKGQRAHQECVATVKQVSGGFLTTWACFTEALYFLHGLRGWRGQDALWQYVKAQEISLHGPLDDEPMRVYQLMEQYKDLPMDFADASLVSLAETRRLRRIITADNDFFAYRINGQDSFDVIKIGV
jgi:uncharacterized protein